MVTASKAGIVGQQNGGATVYASLTFDDFNQANAFQTDLIEVMLKHMSAAKTNALAEFQDEIGNPPWVPVEQEK